PAGGGGTWAAANGQVQRPNANRHRCARKQKRRRALGPLERVVRPPACHNYFSSSWIRTARSTASISAAVISPILSSRRCLLAVVSWSAIALLIRLPTVTYASLG